MITLDGSTGEGGGQILRTALALSMVTGKPFAIDRIRAKRARPGLLRQHLTCVKAAEAISKARVTGAELGSSALTFAPGPVRGGSYTFAVGSAGSTALVFQTIFPALLVADAPASVMLSGGTHNPLAPTYDYIERVFLPLLARMGAQASVTLHQLGFYPAGGGVWHAAIAPGRLAPLVLEETGPRRMQLIRADVANLPYAIAEREVAAVTAELGWPIDCGRARTVNADGHGNVVSVEIRHEQVCEIFTSFGEIGRSAEAVAAKAAEEVRAYLAAGVPVGPHLADQLLVPLALAGGGALVTVAPTLHTRTNIAVIAQFLPARFSLALLDRNRYRISVTG